MVSCGPENVRFWRLKGGRLRCTSLQLNEHAHSNFTDFAFDAVYGAVDTAAGVNKRLFVSTASGALFQVNYYKRSLECLYQLHAAPITCVVVSQGFCVTGSADCFLRVWPLDFSDFYMQAQHTSPVSSVDVSVDGLKLVLGTTAGAMGMVDLVSTHYVTMTRSHTARVSQLAAAPSHSSAELKYPLPAAHATSSVAFPSSSSSSSSTAVSSSSDPNSKSPPSPQLSIGEFVTVSDDGTIRVWSATTMQQKYEFVSSEERPLCSAYHPLSAVSSSHNVIACGFDSGVVRICHVPSTSVGEFMNKTVCGAFHAMAFL